VVDGKVINRELVWRNTERDRAEGGVGILLRIRIEDYVGCPQLFQVNAGISSNTLCSCLLKTNLSFEYV
jgi:hypothetical protein